MIGTVLALTLEFWVQKPLVQFDQQVFHSPLLVKAVSENDGVAVTDYIQKSPDWKDPEYRSWSPLHAACRATVKRQIFDVVLAEAEDVDLRNVTEQTPLHVAAFHANSYAVQALLKRGASPAALDSEGMNALNFAVLSRDLRTVRALLATKAPTNVLPKSRDPVLYGALPNRQMVQELVKAGADLNLRQEGNQTILLLVMENKVVPDKDRVGWIRLLLESGADPNLMGNDKISPLHHACRAQERLVVNLLLAHGAKVDIVNAQGRTPLHFAVYGSAIGSRQPTPDYGMIESLISKGAKIDVKDAKGVTPLDDAKWDTTGRLQAFLKQAAERAKKVSGSPSFGGESYGFLSTLGRRFSRL